MATEVERMEKMTTRQEEIGQFLVEQALETDSIEKVAGDASQRQYYRLSSRERKSVILMDASRQAQTEMRAFSTVAEHLRRIGLSAPKFFACDWDAGFMVLEDFGDAIFADLMADDTTLELPLYRAAADVLLQLQSTPPLPLQKCDSKWLIEAIGPLFEWYALSAIQTERDAFFEVFAPHTESISSQSEVMILRDFHAENLILLKDRKNVARVGLLDFQDAMIGHPAYDLVSILQDARRDVSDSVEDETVSYFVEKGQHRDIQFRHAYAVLGLQRNLRILGIFARLCRRDGKARYIDFVPRVWRYIEKNLSHPALSEVRLALLPILPEPTDSFLQDFRERCQKCPSQP